MKKKTEKELAKKIHKSIYKYINDNNMSIRELAIMLNIPYTTLFTWLDTLKNNRCIAIKNILFLEEKLGISLIFFD